MQVLNNPSRVKSSHGGSRRDAGRPSASKAIARRRRSGSLKVLSKAEERDYWRWVLETAKDKGLVADMIRALAQVNDIQRGKPYQQPAPLGNGAPADHQLASAITNLLPGATIAQRETVAVLPKQMNNYAGNSRENAPECIDSLQVADSKGNV